MSPAGAVIPQFADLRTAANSRPIRRELLACCRDRSRALEDVHNANSSLRLSEHAPQGVHRSNSTDALRIAGDHAIAK
jgi:hypothetical protein